MLPIDDDRDFNMKTRLKLIERHIQQELKSLLSTNSDCLQHCITHALCEVGTVFASECADHDHVTNCDKCLMLPKLQITITEMLNSREFRESYFGDMEDERQSVKNLIADTQDAFAKLSNWRAHQVRTVNQNRARSDIATDWLSERRLTGVYIHQDFAQKVLPQKFYEAQRDYYGEIGSQFSL
jgi:hypothetical protein